MKVTIKLKQGRCMTTKLWKWLDYSHSTLQSAAAHQRDLSRENYVTTENGLKMASTVAYNLTDNHRYSIVNFNFN